MSFGSHSQSIQPRLQVSLLRMSRSDLELEGVAYDMDTDHSQSLGSASIDEDILPKGEDVYCNLKDELKEKGRLVRFEG